MKFWLLLLSPLVIFLGYEAYNYEPLEDVVNSGWVCPDLSDDDPHALLDIPETWNGTGEGKSRLLYDHYKNVHGITYKPRSQQMTPSCVGNATAAACDILAAIQADGSITERGPPAGASAETIYGWSRISIGQINPGTFGGGSHVRWACSAIQRYGVVPMLEFPEIGIDLRKFDSATCLQYGMKGVPNTLESIGQAHIVVEYIKVTNFDQMRDAVFNGCPVVIGSNVGFGSKYGAQRDKEGFLNRPNSWWKPSRWNHAMCIIGVSDEGRTGALILNSWGSDWIDGPKRFGTEPEGSFWADEKVMNNILGQGDSYAIRYFIGYPRYNIWRQ